MHPAAKIVVGDQLRFQILRGALYPLQRIWLPSADCQATNPRPPRRERMLESRLFLNRSPFKYDVAKLGMTVEVYVEQHVHQFVRGVSLNLVLHFSFEVAVLLEESGE